MTLTEECGRHAGGGGLQFYIEQSGATGDRGDTRREDDEVVEGVGASEGRRGVRGEVRGEAAGGARGEREEDRGREQVREDVRVGERGADDACAEEFWVAFPVQRWAEG